MATVSAVIIPSQKKKDGTWNVKIRVNKDGRSTYLETSHFVNAKQIWKKNQIKDPKLLAMLNPILTEYRLKIGELGTKLSSFTSSKLAVNLTKEEVKAEDINVVEFGRRRVQELKKANRSGSAKNMQATINGLIDFFRTEDIRITDIRVNMLQSYEQFMRSPRTQIRPDQFNRPRKRELAGMTTNGVHNNMRDLRILFNCIRDFYNDEDEGVMIVKHYPFRKYKLPQVEPTNKPKLTVEQVIAIRDFVVEPDSRIELARDLFMLSFYLCGMNSVDMYKLPLPDASDERVNYNRSKTKGRRRDKAYISIFIPDVAKPLYMKYAGTLKNRYVSQYSLNYAIAYGIKKIGKALGFKNPEFYNARHAFGDLARNRCRFSMDDVGLAMNHKDNSNRVTDVYVSKNWDIIDEVQSAVINLLTNHDLAVQHRLSNNGIQISREV
ncbi:Phage integrase SAM-like domain-containing protein [Mucilaginibacter gossypiicola]|uniref:Phage integrase SAM-like domain-containing protein n=1 Tax=Mucilaginibacter gossypiicola TaxID=551995 RepID=A0A1H8AQJ4_9SPHI|nr:phage integrase SAM-like domain-containing protein [Mucilaginibacter gossypiicola]SEM73010.1 Phage integrase SAM-like domain-containing protein [Mucilaginibacter gossypiicola]